MQSAASKQKKIPKLNKHQFKNQRESLTHAQSDIINFRIETKILMAQHDY